MLDENAPTTFYVFAPLSLLAALSVEPVLPPHAESATVRMPAPASARTRRTFECFICPPEGVMGIEVRIPV